MKHKILCVLLSAALLISIFGGVPLRASAASALTASEPCITLLKEMEGFSSKPYNDYTQVTVGYGTKCPEEDYERYMRDGITEEEADALLRQYVAVSEKFINNFADKYSLAFTQQQFDALVLFTYNCGTGWLGEPGIFRSAVINGATGNEFINAICLWCNAGGQVLPALVERRLKEANIYLNGIYSTAVPSNYGYVRYNGNGGSASARVQGFDANDPTAPKATATNEGLTFTGWYTSASGGTKVTVLDISVKGKVLYAQWSSSAASETPPTESTTPEETVPETTEPEQTTPSVTEPEPSASVVVKVTGDYVNVRSGAGTGYSVTGWVTAGKELTITQTAQGSGYTWGKFDGGWICLKYTNYDSVVNGSSEEEKETTVSEYGTVYNATALRIRSSAGTSSSIVGYLSSGARVEILEKKTVNGTVWGRISKGWICMDYIKLESDSSGESSATVIDTGTVVNTNDLRIRSGAGTNNTVLGYLTSGTRVEIYDKSSAIGMVWGRISKGWISLDYVKLDSSTSSSTTVIDTGTVINTNSLRIRSAAGTSNTVLGYLTMGTKVSIYEKMTVGSMIWGRIDQGWISLDYVKLDSSGSDASSATRTVTASSLRIRSAAGTDSSIVGYLTNGSKVTILEQTTVNGTAWGRIDKGWICMDYVA